MAEKAVWRFTPSLAERMASQDSIFRSQVDKMTTEEKLYFLKGLTASMAKHITPEQWISAIQTGLETIEREVWNGHGE